VSINGAFRENAARRQLRRRGFAGGLGIALGEGAGLEVEELFAQAVFVLLLGLFGLGAEVGLVAVGGFPGVEVGDGVFDAGELLFLADGGDSLVDGGFVRALLLIQSFGCDGHASPLFNLGER
jgi:hypothetical protein